jgi:hypothetical protein
MRILALALFLALAGFADPRDSQVVDKDYAPRIEHPAYAGGGPVVAIDEAHRNFHTMGGQYAPFAALLRADGYHVHGQTVPLTADALSGVNVLVIANARAKGPDGAAFSDAEIAAVRAWVEAGGSLLLISDHAPFGAAAASLGRAFGVDMGEGYVAVRQDGKITSQIEFWGKYLGAHPILSGRGKGEQVKHVRSFTGQSLGVPADGVALLIIPDDALEVAGPQGIAALREGRSVPGRRVGGRAQAVALAAGKGRVLVVGEAALFSAQRVRLGGGRPERIGLMVEDDQLFALNALHWLSRILG